MQLALKGVIQTHPFNHVLAFFQVLLDNKELPLDVCEALLLLLQHVTQCRMQLLLALITVYFCHYPWVPKIGNGLIDDKLLHTPPLQYSPHCGVHASVTIGLSSNIDWDGLLRVCFTITASDMEIVGAVLDIAGHCHWVFFIPFPIEWVGNINWVVMVAFRVVDDAQ